MNPTPDHPDQGPLESLADDALTLEIRRLWEILDPPPGDLADGVLATLAAIDLEFEFELLTLVQTGKMAMLPILLYGEEFWRRVVDFDALVEEGVVAPQDLDLFRFCESAEEGWAYVQDYYRDNAERRVRRGRAEEAR